MKNFNALSIVLIVFLMLGSCTKANSQSGREKSGTKIQVALLLDTSNSMDGLIDQAKSRLWDIVNTLTTLKYKGKTPEIEIALYEYGNDRLSSDRNYIRQVVGMTSDLDLLSEKLFSLTTDGGLEYCGAVIRQAVKEIDWGITSSDMKLIYIAGNEEFNQGNVSYKEAIADALRKDIYINTIYCGDRTYGIRELWEDGAVAGKGKYFNIDQNKRVRHITTPYDDRISQCNSRLNATYVAYGRQGEVMQKKQMAQDANAEKVSSANHTSRVVSKSKEIYKNDSWDLVDKYSEDKKSVAQLEQNELPKAWQGKSKQEIEKLIVEKQKERTVIQKEISELAKKRQEYIDEEMKKGNSGEEDLGKAINSSILLFAQVKGYTQS